MTRSSTKNSSPSLQRLQETFDHPPREFSPTPFWWWGGERLELERLRWQMEQLVAGGVYNVVIVQIAPNGPNRGKDADDPPFMSDEWWGFFLAVCEHAQKLGMRIWYDDHIKFYGAHFQGPESVEDERSRGMMLSSLTVEANESSEAQFPPLVEPLAAFVTELNEKGEPKGLPRELPVEGRVVRAKTGGRHRLRLIYASKLGFDFLHRETCDLIHDRTHGEFERRAKSYLGNVIAGSFQDELPPMPTWGRDFARQFRERAGYELRPLLWALWEGETEEAQRIRLDYQRIRGALMEEAYFRPAYDWHRKHGMVCGFDQAMSSRRGYPVDTVGQYADYLRTHRWYAVPGCDHHGEARIHSSLAQHYGHRRVWFEAFHSSGWGGTLEETFDWLLPWWLGGSNLYDPHAVYYSTRGGWFEWAPPSTCWRQPYWRHYKHFAKATSRVCALLTESQHSCEIAVLHPTTTVQAFLTQNGPLPPARAAEIIYHALLGEMHWREPEPGVLDLQHLDFSILDDATLQRSEICEGRLVAGTAAYSTLLLPACVVLEEATVHLLGKFVNAGGRLIALGTAPVAKELKFYFDSHPAVSVEELPGLLKDTPRVISGSMPIRLLCAGEVNMAFVPLAHPSATVQENGAKEWWAGGTKYTFDSKRYQRPMSVTIHESPVSVEVWDPVSGKRFTPVTKLVKEGTRVDLPDDVSPGFFLIWTAGDETAVATVPVWIKARELFSPWKSVLEPTIENRFGDLSWPAHEDSPPVQTWYFKHRKQAGDTSEWPEGSYEIAHATFGPQGWRRGPVEEADLQPDMQGDGWQPAVYSLSRGIDHDRLHDWTIGSSGHVPQKFLDFGMMKKGQGAQFVTSVWQDAPCAVHLAIGAPGRKTARVNGQSLAETSRGHLWMHPVELRAGWNRIEWQFIADDDGRAGCYWALVTEPSRFYRPDFMTSVDAPQSGSSLVFTRDFDLPFDVKKGEIQISTTGPCRTILDGAEVGRVSIFKRGRATSVWSLAGLKRGPHRIEMQMADSAWHVRLLVDAEWHGSDGRAWELLSGADWKVSRDGGTSQPVKLLLDAPPHEPASLMRRRRPHPLPRAHWLELQPADGTVLDVQPDPFAGAPRIEWFQWTLPPGASKMTLSVTGKATFWVDGQVIDVKGETATLPFPQQPGRIATLRVETDRGSSGGGLFLAPVTYEMETGAIRLGDWSEQGLESYSGGVRYQNEFEWGTVDARRVMLDLGHVRGTAEVWINGQNAGVRFLSPYRFEITGLIRAGKNEVEVLVLNTLAPYLSGHSPTLFVLSGQTISGLFGPVQLLRASS